MPNKLLKFDFSNDFDFESNDFYYAFLNGEKIIFRTFQKYDGPITLQYLPSGGIQSLFAYKLIIRVNNGFLEIDELEVDGDVISSKTFIENKGELGLINMIFSSDE